ncbi:MAG: TonB-dependent receptor [Cytophagaceae bacterium]|nr:TonB-dependent receptor [Cytophagaceae bacterium]
MRPTNAIRILFFLLVPVFSWAQMICVKDESSFRKIEELSISLDGLSWQLVSTCFTPSVPSDSIYLKAPGYLTIKVSVNQARSNGIVLLTPDYHTLQEFVISPNRTYEKKKDVAQEMHSIKAAEIYKSQAATTADVLMQSGEVFVQKSQAAGGSPVLRGFEANRILLVVDGVRMNNLMFRAGHLQNIISVDPFSLESTDVLMGPSSVMYGSDAMGGVIHLRTRKLSFLKSDSAERIGGQAFIRGYSAMRATQYHADLEVKGKKMANMISFTFYQSSDVAAGRNRPASYGKWGLDTFYVDRFDNKDSVYKNSKNWIQRYSGYNQKDFMNKWMLKTGAGSKLIAGVQYSVSSDAPRYDRLEQVRNGNARFAEWYYGPQKRSLNYLKWEFTTPVKWYDRMTVLGAYQYFRESRHQRSLNSTRLQNRIERAQVFSVNVDLTKKIGKHEYRYGLEATSQLLASKAYEKNVISGEEKSLDTRYPDGGSGMQTLGVYAFDALELSEKWILQGAARYTLTALQAKFRDTTFFKFPFSNVKQQHQALTGSVSVIWMPVEKVKNVLLFSSAFKSPNVDDLAKIFESVKGNVILPDENSKPERTYTAEYGFELVSSKWYHFQARAYYTWYQDVLTLAPTTYQGQDSILYDGVLSRVMSMQNKNKGYLYGGFSSLWLKLGDFQFQQSATVTMGKIVQSPKDVYLDHIPPFVGRSALTFQKKFLTTEVSALYNGMKPIREFSLSGEDNQDQTLPSGSPSWMVLSIKNQVAIQKTLVVSFSIENITDRYYRPFASGIAGPGRNFIIGVKANF